MEVTVLASAVGGLLLGGAVRGVGVVRGEAKAAVVVPAGGSTRTDAFRGATDLIHYVARITSRTLPLVAEDRGLYRRQGTAWKLTRFSPEAPAPQPGVRIHVGWTRRALREVGKAALEGKDMDAFLIRATPDAVFLVGKNDWGTAYACWEFLEAHGNVRWFMPGEFGEDVPQQETLIVPEGERLYEPAYGHRQYSYATGGWRDGREQLDWLARNRVRARLYYHHNLYQVFDPGKWAAKHPDVFPILGGKRRTPGRGNSGGWQPCLTHPAAVEITMDYAREFFKKRRTAGSISLGINDGGGYCECARCLKTVDESLPEAGRRSRWFFEYANAVAERFDEEFPHRCIGFLLYGRCKLPPKDLEIHPRLIGFLVKTSSSLITEEGKREFDELLAEQRKYTPHFALYDWFYGAQLYIPRLQIRQAKYWLEHGYEMGARHIKAEAYMNWGLDGFKYWLHARLMWAPSRDVDAMLDEFFPRFFKESAGPMREYFRIVEELTVKPVMAVAEDGTEHPVNFGFRQPKQFDSFPPEAVQRCEPLLDEAAQLARAFVVQKRVAYYRSGFDVAKRMTLQYHLGKKALPLLGDPETLPEGMPHLVAALQQVREAHELYEWRLTGDWHCVTSPYGITPNASIFEVPSRGRIAAATTLARGAVDALRARGGAVTPALAAQALGAVLERSLARIGDRNAYDLCKREIVPMAGKIAICNRAAAPAIDGRLDDECWQRAAVHSDFIQGDTIKPAEFRTEMRTAHDGSRLFVAFRCRQDPAKMLLWTTNRDGRVWREESVELLLNRPADTKAEERCQVIVGARGNIFDYFNGSAKWDGDIAVGARLENDGYVVELSVPLADIGWAPSKERFLRANFARNVYAREQLRGGNPRETSTWYSTAFGNLDPQARGWLIFND